MQRIIDSPELRMLDGSEIECYLVEWTEYDVGTWDYEHLLPAGEVAAYRAQQQGPDEPETKTEL